MSNLQVTRLPALEGKCMHRPAPSAPLSVPKYTKENLERKKIPSSDLGQLFSDIVLSGFE
jgi:hypothetical protein